MSSLYFQFSLIVYTIQVQLRNLKQSKLHNLLEFVRVAYQNY